jgi:hypothetical protein
MGLTTVLYLVYTSHLQNNVRRRAAHRRLWRTRSALLRRYVELRLSSEQAGWAEGLFATSRRFYAAVFQVIVS